MGILKTLSYGLVWMLEYRPGDGLDVNREDGVAEPKVLATLGYFLDDGLWWIRFSLPLVGGCCACSYWMITLVMGWMSTGRMALLRSQRYD